MTLDAQLADYALILALRVELARCQGRFNGLASFLEEDGKSIMALMCRQQSQEIQILFDNYFAPEKAA